MVNGRIFRKGHLRYDMKKLSFLIIIMSLLSSTVVCADEFDYKVIDGKLHIFGYTLEPKFPIKASSPPEDDDTLISFNRSPSGRWLIIRTGYMEKTEMWLYDANNKTKPIKIDLSPRGRHINSMWYGVDIFEIEHAGMGYRTSDFYQAQDLGKTFRVDSLLLYDLGMDIYVSFYMDGIEVGKGFAKGDLKPERFDIELDYKYVSDAMFTIEEVKIQGRRVIVTHRKSDDSLVEESFISTHLEKTAVDTDDNHASTVSYDEFFMEEISIGSTYDEVVSSLGEPVKIKKEIITGGQGLFVYYEGVEIVISEDEVVNITITGGGYELRNGIAVGSTKHEVFNKLGKEKGDIHNDINIVRYTVTTPQGDYSDAQLIIHFKGDTVVKIIFFFEYV